MKQLRKIFSEIQSSTIDQNDIFDEKKSIEMEKVDLFQRNRKL